MTGLSPSPIFRSTTYRRFVLALNLLDVQVETPVELVPGHWLRRPTLDEIPPLRKGLHSFGEGHGHFWETLFESTDERTPEDIEKFRNRFVKSDDPCVWRYWGVEVAEDYRNGTELHRLIQVSRLLPTPLPFYLYVNQTPKGLVSSLAGMAGASSFSSLGGDRLMRPVDQPFIDKVRTLFQQVTDLPRDFQHILRSLYMHYHLVSIGRANPWYTLGVFAVIESLLTHDPKGGYDSLGHQISTKMQLLNNRFDVPLTTTMFGSFDPTKVWSYLYEFRSCVAHGGQPDFSKGKLANIKSQQLSLDFLDLAAKQLLIQALKEPQLMTDLQRC